MSCDKVRASKSLGKPKEKMFDTKRAVILYASISRHLLNAHHLLLLYLCTLPLPEIIRDYTKKFENYLENPYICSSKCQLSFEADSQIRGRLLPFSWTHQARRRC